MASHYHNKQAVRWLVTAKCSMSLCLFHAALINTLRERTLLSPCNVYLRCVKHGPSVSSLFLEVDFFQTPPVEILSSRRSQTFLFIKIFHLCIIYFEKFDSINVLLRNAYTPCSNFYFPKIMLHNFFIIIYSKKIISLFKGI